MDLDVTEIIRRLDENLQIVIAWHPEAPNLAADRCEHSRHRTLAHLRACQEQWLSIAHAFASRLNPSIKVLHPWRIFDAEHYAGLPWEVHLAKYMSDREAWKKLLAEADLQRSGKWNGKPDTILGLALRLVSHETHRFDVLDKAQTRKKRGSL
ncbi:MAG: hypothetical protein K1X67_26360 [Fimbriimonadaceae bacterium]|nr:hypothetical protein [Fimbriimonadaceae bacterium]